MIKSLRDFTPSAEVEGGSGVAPNFSLSLSLASLISVLNRVDNEAWSKATCDGVRVASYQKTVVNPRVLSTAHAYKPSKPAPWTRAVLSPVIHEVCVESASVVAHKKWQFIAHFFEKECLTHCKLLPAHNSLGLPLEVAEMAGSW